MVHKNSSTYPISRTRNVIEVSSDDGTKTIGKIIDNVFIKSNFHSSKHLCHKHKEAIGIDLNAFNEYIKHNASIIKCDDKDTDITYTIDTRSFELNAVIDNLGSGWQMFCPIKQFTRGDDGKSNRQLSFAEV